MTTNPSTLPNVPPGTVLKLDKEDWRYGGHTLLLMVEFVRLDLSVYYENQWVWISGQQLARDGSPMGHLDALVRVSALPTCPGALANGGPSAPPRPAGSSGDGSPPPARPTPAPRQRVRNDGQRPRGDHDPDRRVEPHQEQSWAPHPSQE